MRTNQLDIKDIDAATLIQLEEIRDAGFEASVRAEKLLMANGATFIHHPIRKGISVSSTSIEFDYQLTILPNPADLTTSVLFSLPSEAQEAKLKIFDLYQNPGQQLMEIATDEYTNSAQINTSLLNTGIYVVYLEVDGIGVASEQLLVIH